jgi:hypothetical protein
MGIVFRRQRHVKERCALPFGHRNRHSGLARVASESIQLHPSVGRLHLSKRGTEIAGHVETAAQPGIAEARGEFDATAAKDEDQR